jgi:hypothetical protein
MVTEIIQSTWERQKRENKEQYELFKKYLEIGQTRSVHKVFHLHQDVINFRSQAVVEKIARKWNWKRRAYDFDMHNRREAIKELEEHFQNFVTKQVSRGIIRVGILDENIQEIREDEKLTPYRKSLAYKHNSTSYYAELQALLLLAGRPTQITQQENTIDMNIKQEQEAVNNDEELDKLFEEIEEGIKELTEKNNKKKKIGNDEVVEGELQKKEK